MAYPIDPERAGLLASTRAGCRPRRYELIELLRDRYPGLNLELLEPHADLRAAARRRGTAQNLFYESVEKRLLCCNVRKVMPLTKHLATLDAWITGPAPRPVGDPHEHPQGRDRPRPRRDREAEPARRVDGGRGAGTTSREHDVPTHPLYAQGYTSIGCEPVHPRDRRRRGSHAPAAGGGRRTRRRSAASTAPIETGGFEHELHAIIGERRSD